MKKILAVVLCLALGMFALVGCGGNKDQQQGQQQQQQQQQQDGQQQDGQQQDGQQGEQGDEDNAPAGADADAEDSQNDADGAADKE